MNDVVINKIQSIQRCIRRAREEYRKNPAGFETDYSVQDAAILNILRACELAIDLANHIIKSHKLGIPTSSGESFELLYKHDILNRQLMTAMKNMVHFRNIVIHDYQQVDFGILMGVITSGLEDLIRFGDRCKAFGDGVRR